MLVAEEILSKQKKKLLESFHGFNSVGIVGTKLDFLTFKGQMPQISSDSALMEDFSLYF